MSFQKQVLKTCCGRSSLLYSVAKPILKEHIPLFVAAGFVIPERYSNSGLFYARKDNFMATCTFGICKITVRCTGSNCQTITQEFESILQKIAS